MTIRSPQDFWSGTALFILAVAVWALASDLGGISGARFGSGTAPRLFAACLGIVSLIVVGRSLVVDGPMFEKVYFRGPLFIIGAIVLFSLGIRPLGLAVTGFVTICLASYASREARLLETLVFAALLTGFCIMVFTFGLGLTIPIWPAG